MVIQHNISSLNSWRNTRINNNSASKNLEKLSSGFKINRAADDAAGLAISEKMRGQIRGLNMAKMNIDHGVNLVKTADGGIAEIHDTLQRIRELSVQMTNGTYTDEDRAMAQLEVKQLYDNIDLIANTTHFNGIHMLRDNATSADDPQLPSIPGGTPGGIPGQVPGATTEELLDTFSTKLYPNASVPHSESFNLFGENLDITYVLNGDSVIATGEIDGIQKTATVNLSGDFSVVYGSSKNDFSSDASNIIRTSDGGYLVLVHTRGEDGDMLDYDGKDGSINTGCYAADGDGGLRSFTNDGSDKTWVLKLDSNGNKEWSTVIGSHVPGSSLTSYSPFQALELSNGNFAIGINVHASDIGSNAQIVIVDKNGDYVTHENLNYFKSSGLADMIITDNGILALGTYSTYDSILDEWKPHTFARILGNDGKLKQDIPLLGDGNNYPVSILQLTDGSIKISNGTKYNIATSDGGYIAAGTDNSGVLPDFYAIKYDASGNEIWRRTYGGNSFELCFGIIDNGDGTFSLAGLTTSNNSGDVGSLGGNEDIWFITIDETNGDLLEAQNMGGSGDESLWSIGSDGNGSFWFLGSDSITSSDIRIYADIKQGDKKVSLNLDNYVLETDTDGNPTKWISFSKCEGIVSGDGTTLKEITVTANLYSIAAGGTTDPDPDNPTPIDPKPTNPSDKSDNEDIILQVGANQGDTFTIQKSDMRTKTLFKGMNISVSTREAANATIGYVDKVINHVSMERAKFGAYQNALEHIQQNVMNGSENLQFAESSIRDVDMAKEMMEFTKNNILAQAAQSMLAQANQLPQGVLSLLRAS